MYDKTKFKKKLALFEREYNRVEPYINDRRPITTDETLRGEYKQDLIRTYNDLIDTIDPKLLTEAEKSEVLPKLERNLNKFKNAFTVLELIYTFEEGNLFSKIDIDLVTTLADTQLDVSFSTPNNTLINTSDALSDKSGDSENNYDSNKSDSEEENPTMTKQTKQEFIALANRMINYKYEGDPLALDSFLDAIDLLNDLCEEENLPTFVKFLMTRLDGKARESILATPTTVKEIVDQLKDGVKPESSKVIEGRILALRADNTSLTKFAERAEELADQFRRSLVLEGFSKEKAKEITIEKTVEMCRKSAKSDLVKSVLASSKFSEPKEAIAKMIVEINNVKQEKNHAYSHKSGKNQQHGQNSNNFNKNKNGNFQKNQNRNDNRNYKQGNQSNGHGQNNGSRNGGYNGNRNGQTSGNQNWRNNSNAQHRSNDNNVRVFSSGNELNPGNGGLQMQQ